MNLMKSLMNLAGFFVLSCLILSHVDFDPHIKLIPRPSYRSQINFNAKKGGQ